MNSLDELLDLQENCKKSENLCKKLYSHPTKENSKTRQQGKRKGEGERKVEKTLRVLKTSLLATFRKRREREGEKRGPLNVQSFSSHPN